jgi:hypothetical protein
MVVAKGLGVSTDRPLKLALSIKNNKRNLQLPMDIGGFNATVTWEATRLASEISSEPRTVRLGGTQNGAGVIQFQAAALSSMG